MVLRLTHLPQQSKWYVELFLSDFGNVNSAAENILEFRLKVKAATLKS